MRKRLRISIMRRRSRISQALFLLAFVMGAGHKAPMAGREKNPHAMALGKMGGAKGGKARAAKMTAEERSASAKKAALARWAKVKKAREKGRA